MSMISSVRRLPRTAGTSGWSGSTTGDGAVMLLTGTSWRLAGPRPRSRGPRGGRRQCAGRDAEHLRGRAHSAGAGRPLAGGERAGAGVGRLGAEVGGAAGGVFLLGRGHLGLVRAVRVLLGDPELLHRVLSPALRDGSVDVRHRLADLGQAA